MSEVKIFSYEDVAKHNTGEDCWMIIDGKVYDCTKFLPEHPGGEEVVVDCAGEDATQAFEDIGHTDDAYEMLKDMYVGDIDPETAPVVSNTSSGNSTTSGESQLPLILAILVALVAAVYFIIANQK